MDKYTEIKEFRRGFEVFLKVDHQRFCVTPTAYETRIEAEWMRCQLALALHKLVAKETK